MMKELYTAPELELLCLTAEERLAAELDFDDLMGSAGEGVSVDINTDVEVPLI